MIEKLAINQGIIAPRFETGETNKPVTRPEINIKDIAPQTNRACQAYGMAMVRKPIETLSLDDCIRQLRKDGKRPGKDFTLERNNTGFAKINIKNTYGQPTKIIGYQNRKPQWYENRFYTGTKLIKSIHHNSANSLSKTKSFYSNKEMPQTAFTPEGITYETTVDEYIQYLNENNVKFKIQDETFANENDTKIIEYDNIGNKTQTTAFSHDYNNNENIVTRELQNGNIIKRIEFNENETLVSIIK